jgi:hypothetical protein
MSQQLSFTITASDQASKVVDQVKKKVADMGKDVGRSIANFVTPVAVVTGAISMISSKMAELKQKAQEAFNWGAGLSESAAAMGVSVEQFQKLQDIANRSGQPIANVGKAFKAASDLIAEAKGGNLAAAESLEALGFKLKDLENIKPEDVVSALGDALATIENPTDKAAAAFAAFGAEGKALIQTLERIRGLAKGPAPEGLTQDEADFLAEANRQDEAIKNREKLAMAREAVSARFLKDSKNKEALEQARGIARDDLISKGMQGPALAAFLANEDIIAKNPKVQEFIRNLIKKQREAEAAPQTPEAAAAGEAAANLGKKRQEKEEKEKKEKEDKDKEKKKDEPKSPAKIKEEVERYAPLTVSSLREIGGGMAGEVSMAEQIAKDSLEYQRRTAEALEKIIQSQQPITDFTKPLPANLPVGVGPGGRGIG